jgi:ABC-type molybdate transport system substrate-binding protein
MRVFSLRNMLVAACVATLCFANAAAAETFRVAAAISLKEAMTQIIDQYQSATGDKVELNLGSSGQLATEIKTGAEIDVFVSAATKQIDDLAKAGVVDGRTRRNVASNELVLIVPPEAKALPRSFEALAAVREKVAVGEPRTVPAGQYAAQVFQSGAGLSIPQADRQARRPAGLRDERAAGAGLRRARRSRGRDRLRDGRGRG